MNYITHSIGGFGAGLAAGSLMGGLDEIGTATVISGALLGSLFPDIDHTKSFIGRKAPIVSHVAAAAFKHRGFLHTPLFIAIFSVALLLGVPLILSGAELGIAMLFIKGFIPGMLSHIILDSFNKGGISWLWPITKKRFRVLSIKTDSIMESAFSFGLMALIAVTFLI